MKVYTTFGKEEIKAKSITFEIDENTKIDICFDEETQSLNINTNWDGLSIHPLVANNITVSLVKT